jgi:hypothetical protein
MRRLAVLLIALAPVYGCAGHPDAGTAVGTFVSSSRSVTLAGIVTKKATGPKEYESYNAEFHLGDAPGGYYYVLDVRGSVSASGAAGDMASHISTVAPDRWTAREGVILRPSNSVRFSNFARFAGKRVEVQGVYVDGERWRPPADYEGQYIMPSRDPRTGKQVWPIRGSGFEAQGVRLASDAGR